MKLLEELLSSTQPLSTFSNISPLARYLGKPFQLAAFSYPPPTELDTVYPLGTRENLA